MPTYNYKARELIAKIVYYGPGRCGKTTNLQQIHAKMRPETRSDLLSVATETDRTIYFDLLPLNLGTINGMKFMVRLFTVPGQVYYAETRKLVLRGTDGVVFVADSQNHMLDENRESLRDLKTNLAANGIDYNSIPLVLQYNKRDLPRLVSEAELDATLNDRGVKGLPAVASVGTGVLETLRFITVGVFNHIKMTSGTQTGASPARPRGASQAAPPPPPPSSTTPRAATTDDAPLPSLPETFGAVPQAPQLNLGAPPPPVAAPAPRGTSRAAALEGALAAARNAGRVSTGQMPAIQRETAAPVAAPMSSGPIPTPVPPMGVPLPAITTQTAPLWPPPRNGPSAERPPPPPASLGAEVLFDEFKSLAVMQSQLAERLTTIEQEVKRLGRENQEIRERLARRSE
jgi:signal recognition particle receptor subunit beta